MILPDAELLIKQIADQIRPTLKANSALVGIHTGGAWVAEKLHKLLGAEIPLGTLDIAFYRDDFSRIGLHPVVKPSNIPFEVEEADIILVDDVLFTGRTVRAALNNLFDYGRPAHITLAVLIDRGGREVPICAEYVGVTLELEASKNVQLVRQDTGILNLYLKVAE